MTPWGGRLVHRATTASTMDDAQALEDEGAPDGSLVWADHQSAGRGRFADRVWVDTPGEQLLFTTFWSPLRFVARDFAPSLTVGLGVCLWVEALVPGAPVALKWPNDVYLGDAKLAGILVRTRLTSLGPRSIHAGIGVNLRVPRGEFRSPPTGLSAWGVDLRPDQALASLLPFLARALEEPRPHPLCEQRLWRRGAEVEMNLPSGPGRGLVRGLDPNGRLWWEGPGGLEALSSGE